MGLISEALYSTFPGLRQAEAEAEKAVDCLQNSFELGKKIGGYVLDRNDEIINNVKNSIGHYFSGLTKTLINDFEDYASPGNGSGMDGARQTYRQRPSQASHSAQASQPFTEKKSGQVTSIVLPPSSQPASLDNHGGSEEQEVYENKNYENKKHKESFREAYSKPAKSKTKDRTLDEVIKNFKEDLKNLNKDYDASIDIYECKSKIKSYAAQDLEDDSVDSEVIDKSCAAGSKYLDSLVSGASHEYIKNSFKITELYNQGLNTHRIRYKIRKTVFGNNAVLRDYNELTDRVALAISLGSTYLRGHYNNAVAEKLGAREQIINNYLSGKSYKEIKQNLKKNTNGMTISDSSILRIMHDYEKKTRKKVVGKRRRKGRGKTMSKKHGKKGQKSGNEKKGKKG